MVQVGRGLFKVETWTMAGVNWDLFGFNEISMGFIGVWRANACKKHTQAIVHQPRSACPHAITRYRPCGDSVDFPVNPPSVYAKDVLYY